MKSTGGTDKFYNYGFPIQAVLVTCKDKKDGVNVFTVAWHTPVSRYPPLFGIFVSKKRYSRDIIESSGEFVVNFMPFDLVEKVDFCGTHSGRDIDKIKETGLSLEKGSIDTPYIGECTACFECEVFDHKKVGDHSFFIGKIKNVLYESDLFTDNILKIEKISPCFYLGGGIYTKISDFKKEFE